MRVSLILLIMLLIFSTSVDGKKRVIADNSPFAASAILVSTDNQTIMAKNEHVVRPIASITKLMTAIVAVESGQLDQQVTITDNDVEATKPSHSVLAVGTTLTRLDLLNIALIASDNRAAVALGRSYGPAFVARMNMKAHQLRMYSSQFVEPSGLDSANTSTASDLAILVNAGYNNETIHEISSKAHYYLITSNQVLTFNNTNGLVGDPNWDIGLSKTGTLRSSGKCLIMRITIAAHNFIVVILDAKNHSRLTTAKGIRQWIETKFIPHAHNNIESS